MANLVTGGEGFIGSNLVKNLPDAFSYDLKSGQDILDQTLLSEKLTGVDNVFHFAAKISVPESEEQPELYYRNNVLGTKALIQVAEKTGVKKLIFSSSAAVYGDYNEPVKEDFQLKPTSNYAKNKVEGEKLLADSQLKSITLRYFNVYGQGKDFESSGVIAVLIKKILDGGVIEIHGDGNRTRDFIFIDDITKANLLALDHKSDRLHETFNIGTGRSVTINCLIEIIDYVVGSKTVVKHIEARGGDVYISQVDVSRAKNELGFTSSVTLEEGIERLIKSLV